MSETSVGSLVAGTEDSIAIRITDDLSSVTELTTRRCELALTGDAISKAGTSIGMNGGHVTNEVMNGSDLMIDLSRQTAVDLHAGDEIVRIPIRANVALDTVAMSC